MNRKFFDKLLNEHLSVLIIGLNGKKEAYNGFLKESEKDYIGLELTTQKGCTINKVYIKHSIILSIWVYK